MVRPTTNMDIVARIMNHPDVYDWIRDDRSPADYKPILHPMFIYLIDDTESGVIRVDPLNGVTCSVHMATLPRMWGNGTAETMAREAIEWGFRCTHYLKIQAIVPAKNPYVQGLLERLGFEHEGIMRKSFLINSELIDQHVYGLVKEGGICQQQQYQ